MTSAVEPSEPSSSRQPTSTAGRYAAALRLRDFRLLVLTLLVESIGGWTSGVVLAVYVFDQTRSLPFVAAMAAAKWIPGLLVAPLAGLVADRYDRRTVMAVAGVANAAVGALRVAVILLGAPIGLLLVLQVLAATAYAPFRPAAGALPPDVVGEAMLPTANSIFAAVENLVVVIGPAVGGVILLLHAPVLGVALGSASALAAAVMARALHVRSRGGAEEGVHLVRQLLGGVAALRDTPTAAVLLLFAAIDTLLANAYTVVYIPISEHLGTGSGGYGYLLAASACGAVIGSLFVERLAAARRLAPIIVTGLLLQAVPYALTVFTGSPVVGALLQVVSGLGMALVDVPALVALQREVAPGRLSRVLGVLDTVALLASITGSFAVSLLLSTLPYGVGLVTLGAGFAVLAIACSPLVVRADRRAARTAVALEDRVGVLSRLELFADAGTAALERIAAVVVPVRAPAGTVLIREGESADALWVVVEGSLTVRSTTQRGALPDVHGPDVVGEIGVLRRAPRTATVAAAVDTLLWRIEAEDYREAVTADPDALLGSQQVTLRLSRTESALPTRLVPA